MEAANRAVGHGRVNDTGERALKGGSPQRPGAAAAHAAIVESASTPRSTTRSSKRRRSDSEPLIPAQAGIQCYSER
jgi:hypothetical protein